MSLTTASQTIGTFTRWPLPAVCFVANFDATGLDSTYYQQYSQYSSYGPTFSSGEHCPYPNLTGGTSSALSYSPCSLHAQAHTHANKQP